MDVIASQFIQSGHRGYSVLDLINLFWLLHKVNTVLRHLCVSVFLFSRNHEFAVMI